MININKYESFRNTLPAGITDEGLDRILSCYDAKQKAFVMNLPDYEICETVRGVTYHVIPHYADDEAESVASKLTRIMKSELEKD